MYARICRFLVLIPILAFPVLLNAQSALVNINTANSEELQTLDGIGPTYAQRIIDYRNANGPFGNIEEIKNVSGIGEVTFSNIKYFITVGEGETGDTPNLSDAGDEDESSGNQNLSSHYSSEKITNAQASSNLKIGAGRDRIGSVGSPIEFKVETNFNYAGRKDMFKWNFGDGDKGTGDVLTHIYEYPGEYIVMLRAITSEGELVARAKVKVIDPQVQVVFANQDRIEVKNNSQMEVSLFGRALFTQGQSFVFPVDTIIGPNQSISFSSRVTKLAPLTTNEVWLVAVGEDTRLMNVIAQVEEEKMAKIAAIQTELNVLQGKLATLNYSRQIAQASNPVTPSVAVEVAEPEEDENIELSQTALVVESIAEKETNMFVSWFEKFKRFFLRKE